MNTRRISDGVMPWAGLIGGAFGFALAHQIGSDTTFANCVAGSPWTVAAAALIGLLLAGAGAFGSWAVYRREGEGPARRLIAAVSLMTSALVALAIVLPLIASLIIPPCFA